MRTPNYSFVLLAFGFGLSGFLAVGCETTEGPEEDDTSSSDDGGDDDDNDDQYAYFEDFERSEADLEHDGYAYYESYDEMAEASSGLSAGVVPLSAPAPGGTNVFGLLWAEDYLSASEPIGIDPTTTWTYAGPPFDLTSCTSGSVTLDWGFVLFYSTEFNYELEYEARVEYGGMGESEDYPCIGTTSLNDINGSYWSGSIECPVDFDCGYDSAGVFDVKMRVVIWCNEDTECTVDEGWLGAMTWIDNIGVQLNE